MKHFFSEKEKDVNHLSSGMLLVTVIRSVPISNQQGLPYWYGTSSGSVRENIHMNLETRLQHNT